MHKLTVLECAAKSVKSYFTYTTRENSRVSCFRAIWVIHSIGDLQQQTNQQTTVMLLVSYVSKYSQKLYIQLTHLAYLKQLFQCRTTKV